MLQKALGSSGQDTTLSAEASQLSHQSLDSQATDSLPGTPRRKPNLMKKIVRSLSFKASPRSRKEGGMKTDQRQISEIGPFLMEGKV